jgi:hypothetical protein
MKWSAIRGDMTVRGRGVIAGAVAGWWSYVVVDFAIHAVVLESWWRSTQSYWIPPVEMARRIPFAYLAFAMYCLGLSWVVVAMRGQPLRVSQGFRVGALAGAAFGAMSALGAYSVVRLPVSFLVVGPGSTAACSGIAGAAASWVAGGNRRWRRVGLVFAFGLAVFVAGVVGQNIMHAALTGATAP